MIKKILITLIVFTFAAFAQNGDDLLRTVQNKYKSIQDLTADVKMSGNSSFSGKISYKHDNMFRVELPNATIISNGSTMWNFNKKDNKVIINEVDETNPSAFSMDTFLDEYPGRTNAAIEKNNGKNVLILTPKKNEQLNFNRVAITLTNENLVEKISLEKPSGTTTITLSNYKVNQNLDDAKFNFIPPKGSSVVDLR